MEAIHAETCSTSCYHCLRHYHNRQNHERLDWRLGLDLVELLLGSRKTFDFESVWWEQYIQHIFPKRLALMTGEEWSRATVNEHPCFVRSDRSFAIVPVHPLTNVEHRSFQACKDTYKELSGCDLLGCLDVYEFERQPITSLQKMKSEAV